MSTGSASVGGAAAGFTGEESAVGAGEVECPACGETLRSEAIEAYGRYKLLGCGGCGLQFWSPRELPDARWYEQMYGGRDEKILPLEAGHKYFLKDALAPRGGELLDIGCGTGNFLAAARAAGYGVTGTELDRNAARFALERLELPRVLPLTAGEFAREYPSEKFDVVTFFEVLEHQAAPEEFLRDVKACLRSHGYVALSVPNRERWLTGPDVFDYPPNHFLRWNATALKNFLSARGFEVLSVREQSAGIVHTAQMINMALRTGMSKNGGAGGAASFRDVMQMPAEKAAAVLSARTSMRQRVMQMLGRIKYQACYPLAVAAYPYVKLRGYKGTYLYCLARLRD